MTPSIKETVERLRHPLQVVVRGAINNPSHATLDEQDARKAMFEAAALIERLAGALEPFANAGSMEIKGNGMVNVLLFIEDIERARRALSGEPTRPLTN